MIWDTLYSFRDVHYTDKGCVGVFGGFGSIWETSSAVFLDCRGMQRLWDDLVAFVNGFLMFST